MRTADDLGIEILFWGDGADECSADAPDIQEPCEIDGIEMDVPSPPPPPPGEPPPPEQPPPPCDPVLENCGGGGGDPGGSGADHPGGSTAGSLRNDESDEPAPDCSRTDLDPTSQKWCEGDEPTSQEDQQLGAWAAQINIRCGYLGDNWLIAQNNVRLFDWTGQGFGGGAAVGGDWILISREWLNIDPEAALAHELLHIEGYSHPDGTPAFDQFVERERTCSGGNSTLVDFGNQY